MNPNHLPKTLEVNNISYSTTTHLLFSEVSFAIPPKSIILLTGKNGVGKTTLLRIIAGLLSPKEGSFSFSDAKQKNISRLDLLSHSMYLHQNPYIYRANVKQNITLDFFITRHNKVKLNNALHQTDLSNIKKSFAPALSGGERQRVALARALYKPKPILLFDEPTSNLDKHFREKFTNIIVKLREKGHSAIISTHIPSLILKHCDIHWHIKSGKLLMNKV